MHQSPLRDLLNFQNPGVPVLLHQNASGCGTEICILINSLILCPINSEFNFLLMECNVKCAYSMVDEKNILKMCYCLLRKGRERWERNRGRWFIGESNMQVVTVFFIWPIYHSVVSKISSNKRLPSHIHCFQCFRIYCVLGIWVKFFYSLIF